MATAICEAGAEFSTARRAGDYVRLFYPDVSVTVDRKAAQLASDERDAAALRLIWRSVLANEALLARAAAQRAAVIEALLR